MVGKPENARSQNRLLPHIGQLLRTQANAVECRFDPGAAHFVRGGAHDRVERGNLLQFGHCLAVLCPQKDRAIELVTGKQRTQPSTFRADILSGAQASPVAAAELAGCRLAGGEGPESRCEVRRCEGRRRRGCEGRRHGRDGLRDRCERRCRGCDGLRDWCEWRRDRCDGRSLICCGCDDERRPAYVAESRTGYAEPVSLRTSEKGCGSGHRLSFPVARGKLQCPAN